MSWIDPNPATGTKDGALTAPMKARLLPFALMSRDIYPKFTGSSNLAGGVLYRKWIDVFANPREQAKFTRLDLLEAELGTALGFNAALYKLHGRFDSCVVVAFQGSNPISIMGPQAIAKTAQSWLFANMSTTLDVVNKYGETLIDKVTNAFGISGVFSTFLNPRRAPSTAYDLADLMVRSVCQQFPRNNVILTGHSLGGGMAQYAAMRHNLRAVVFNSAGTGLSGLDQIGAENIVRIDTNGNSLSNYAVTQLSDFASKHYGSRYVIGKGGHGIDEIIRLLR